LLQASKQYKTCSLLQKVMAFAFVQGRAFFLDAHCRASVRLMVHKAVVGCKLTKLEGVYVNSMVKTSSFWLKKIGGRSYSYFLKIHLVFVVF